jgi:hypothetical protein
MIQDQVANSVLLRKTHTRNLEELIEGCAGVHMTVEPEEPDRVQHSDASECTRHLS